MAVLSIAICDDDVLALEEEYDIIKSVLKEQKIHYRIDKFDNPQILIEQKNSYDIVFLDVEMGNMNGIETAEAIHTKSPECLIFFVTNHEDYIDEALNKHAFRFWTKPINKTRLIYGIQSAIKELNSRYAHITVNVNKTLTKIYMSDILYVYHSGRCTYIVTTYGEIQTYETFQNVVCQLSEIYFFESHMSCYVNLNYITDYNKTDIICSYDGKDYKAFISKRKYKDFDRRFKEWSGGLK